MPIAKPKHSKKKQKNFIMVLKRVETVELPPSALKPSKKRSRDDESDITTSQEKQEQEQQGQTTTKKQKKSKKKKKKKNKDDASSSAVVDPSVAMKISKKQTNKLLSKGPAIENGTLAWFRHYYETKFSKLSKLEMYPNMNGFTAENFFQNDNSMADTKQLLTKEKKKALIVTFSAVRACALMKLLSGVKRPFAKLFAKHMKLHDQVDFLKKRKPTLGIGTPGRILQLAEQGALNSFFQDKEAVIIIDMTPDIKKFTVLTMPMVGDSVFEMIKNHWMTKAVQERPKLNFLI